MPGSQDVSNVFEQGSAGFVLIDFRRFSEVFGLALLRHRGILQVLVLPPESLEFV